MNEHEQERNVGSATWQSQTLESPRISLEYVRHHARRLNADFRREVFSVYASIGACVLLLAFMLFRMHEPITGAFAHVLQLSAVLLLAAAVYLVFAMRRRGALLTEQSGDQVTKSLDAYRTELARRRDYYWHSWRWSLLPIVPALLVIVIGSALFDPRPDTFQRLGMALLLAALFTALAIWYHRRKGRECQRELEALATLHPPVSPK